jgi:hypothetical protein
MGSFSELIEKVKEGRVGFKMDEVMTGLHWYEPGCGPEGEHYMQFSGTWGPDNLKGYVDPKSDNFMTQPLDGEVTIGGLCEAAPMKGTLELRYFSEHKIRYAFEFKAGKKKYNFVGEKVNIKPWNLPVSHTTCFGRLTEATTGKLVGTSVTFFKLLDSAKFMGSLRLVKD